MKLTQNVVKNLYKNEKLLECPIIEELGKYQVILLNFNSPKMSDNYELFKKDFGPIWKIDEEK